MKRYLIIIFLSLLTTGLLMQCDRKKTNMKVEGIFKIPFKSPINLGIMGLKATQTIDSTTIDEHGRFKLRAFSKYPTLFVVRYEKEKIYLIVKPDDKISIEIDNTLPKHGYYINGSPDSRLVQNLITEQERVMDQITNISLEYEKSKEALETFTKNKIQFDSIYDNLLSNHKKFTEKFIRENPTSLACIFALYQNFGRTNQALFDPYADIKIFNLVDSNLTSLYPTTPAVVALNRDVTEIKEQINFKKFSDQLVKPGRKAPDFSVETIDTTTISLKNLTGKPVVYFFFASWNHASIAEAQKINDLYLKYKYLGLQLVGISFDKSYEKLKSFIDTNNIQFPIACDYGYWESKYVTQFGVRFIPDLIVLDRNHIINTRDINIDELKLILEEWRKNNMF